MPDEVVMATLDGGGAPFCVAATDRGVTAAGWHVDQGAFRAELQRRLRTGVVGIDEASADAPASVVLRPALAVFERLLDGAHPDAEHVPIDLTDRPSWDQRVLGEVRQVGWGETASYGEIARRVGAPRAARAVGGAIGRNPISLLIPCHRIIAGDGTLGGYGGTGWTDRDRQLSRKEALLAREGVHVSRRTG